LQETRLKASHQHFTAVGQSSGDKGKRRKTRLNLGEGGEGGEGSVRKQAEVANMKSKG
jgi:hypothetical protein